MDKEKLDQANEILDKIEQCEKALKYQTNGVCHSYGLNDGYKIICLPHDVCLEIRKVIDNWLVVYNKQLEEL